MVVMIGVKPPWFQDPVETMAFNLYAMECEEKEEDEDETDNENPK